MYVVGTAFESSFSECNHRAEGSEEAGHEVACIDRCQLRLTGQFQLPFGHCNACHRLGYLVPTGSVGVDTAGTEAVNTDIDEAFFFADQVFRTEAVPLHGTRAIALKEDVGIFYKFVQAGLLLRVGVVKETASLAVGDVSDKVRDLRKLRGSDHEDIRTVLREGYSAGRSGEDTAKFQNFDT